ncbi:MAG: SOUL family heme-binding protein [Gammaproteobacteria bacterium]
MLKQIILILALSSGAVASGVTMAIDEAFPKTPVDEIRVRTLPPGRVLETHASGSYFDQTGKLFRRLFRYIDANDVDMTTPVEGALGTPVMRFHVGADAPAALADTGEVRVRVVPERTVAALGAKGSYREARVREKTAELHAWLEQNADWQAAGPAYGVFWNGPFTPWFLKRFEIHIPVAAAR